MGPRKKGVRPTVTCEHCGLVFARRFTYNRHVQGVHLNRKPYICTWGRESDEPCNYSCSQRFQTVAHIKAIHLAHSKRHKNADPEDFLEVDESLLE